MPKPVKKSKPITNALGGGRPGYGKASPPGSSMGGAKRPVPGKGGIPGPRKAR